jgi:hypothetical protein
MKRLIIYFSSGNDALGAVFTYHDFANNRARELHKPVLIGEVDIDLASDEDKKFWSGTQTIECVTVDTGALRERVVDPSLPRLGRMVEDL